MLTSSLLLPTDVHKNSPGLVADLAIKSSIPGGRGGGSNAQSRILLIEDDLAIAEMYRIQLEADGYRVTVAHHGNIGWDLIRKLEPDLVLLDIRLPGIDGFEILRLVRNDPNLTTLPVVILSNFGDPHMIDRANQLGVRDFVVKSRSTPHQVSGRIRSWITGDSLN